MTTDRPSVLLVDDVDTFRETIRLELEDRGYGVREAADAREAVAMLEAHTFMFVVLDLRLCGDDGHLLIPEVKRLQPSARVVILTGYGSVASAVQAMRLGASNYLTKPSHRPARARAVVRRGRSAGCRGARPTRELGPSRARVSRVRAAAVRRKHHAGCEVARDTPAEPSAEAPKVSASEVAVSALR